MKEKNNNKEAAQCSNKNPKKILYEHFYYTTLSYKFVFIDH